MLEAQKLVASAAQLELPDGPRSAKRLRRGASARRGWGWLGMAGDGWQLAPIWKLWMKLGEAFRVVFWINSFSLLVFVLDSQYFTMILIQNDSKT